MGWSRVSLLSVAVATCALCQTDPWYSCRTSLEHCVQTSLSLREVWRLGSLPRRTGRDDYSVIVSVMTLVSVWPGFLV
jgi:hypothetical protein